jgi:transposase
VKETRAASEPEALVGALRGLDVSLERIGLEACSLTAWLHDELRAAGLPAICIETRQANAAMKTMPNKTDRNDARRWRRSCGLAGIGRFTSRAGHAGCGARCSSPAAPS